MRARLASSSILVLLAVLPARADDPPKPSAAVARARRASPQAVDPPAGPSSIQVAAPAEAPAPPAIVRATPADVARERLSTEARLKELASPEVKEKPQARAIGELLVERRRLLGDWEKAAKERLDAEHPEPSPEKQAADQKAELEKTQALLEQAAKSADSLLPEAFQPRPGAAPSEPRLGEMKEAIDAARNDLKERSTEMESLRVSGSRDLTAHLATLRAERDKAHGEFVTLTARRGEREAAIASASSPEARDLARERLANFDWQSRVEAERLATREALIDLDTRRIDLGSTEVRARAARVQLARKILERMEFRYSALSERQQTALKRAVAKEETRAAQSDDPLERRKAKRTAELLELESQVVAFEKSYATGGAVSLQEQTALADASVAAYAQLRKMIDDGNVSPLDALRLKNDFRRLGPERAQIVRTDLAASDAEMVAYENALTDAEIDLVNDSRDDRYDRESLLEQIPARRRAEASAMLEDLETRHRALLNRRRTVLLNLASRAEEAHKQVVRRLLTIDDQYAFIRTHIFWIRDAEPLGVATVAHARDDSIRTVRALVQLSIEPADRTLWGRMTPDFALAVLAMVALPWPLLLGQKALDRLRIGAVPPAA